MGLVPVPVRRPLPRRGQLIPPITVATDVDRRAEAVFDYATDPEPLLEWQNGVVEGQMCGSRSRRAVDDGVSRFPLFDHRSHRRLPTTTLWLRRLEAIQRLQEEGGERVDGPGVDAVLAKGTSDVRRVTPVETMAALQRGVLVVDTRTETQRAEQGELPGAVVIDRTVLEWRLDPASGASIPEATGYDIEVVVVCRQGYSSRLAAASLRQVGIWRATDMIGGVEAWLDAGLPVDTEPADVRR